ncbi:tail fiber domain-containing protein [Peredibacter sp. HCB2-198]|uniref:tail fiber domain-containing protein n=1 Tax=Peredibacter sp. HCB2-198 TaxID=3383025 RepID=UPI0038B5FA92
MRIKNQHGMGLLEALLAVGVLGGLALVINQLGQNARKAVNNHESNNDVKVTLEQIQSVLSDQDSCTATFIGKNASSSSNIVQALKKKNASGYSDTFMTSAVSPNTTYGQKQLRINSYSLSDAAPEVDVSAQGTTQLLVNFNRGTKGVQASSISQKVNLRVVLDGSGNITNCVAFNASTSDIWKQVTNSSNIYFNTGHVGVGVNAPTSNLTVRASTFPLQPGLHILGNENATAGWNRSAVNYSDTSSAEFWRVALFGANSLEGEGKFGINTTGGVNRVIFTKSGSMGIGTTRPNCEMTACENSDNGDPSYVQKYLHIHSSAAGPTDYSSVFLSSNAMGDNEIVGSFGFASTSRTEGHDRRVGVITGHVSSPAGTPLKGSMLFWTNDGTGTRWNMILTEIGDLWIRGIFSVGGTVSERSDESLKKNIRPLSSSLHKINKLQGVSYEWKNKKDQGAQVGLIAQDVEKVYPEVVSQDRSTKSIWYSGLLAPVIDSIKELHRDILWRSKKIKKLKAENQELKDYLCSQKGVIEFCSGKEGQ